MLIKIYKISSEFFCVFERFLNFTDGGQESYILRELPNNKISHFHIICRRNIRKTFAAFPSQHSHSLACID